MTNLLAELEIRRKRCRCHPDSPQKRKQEVDIPATLNEQLLWLQQFGKPRVGVYGRGGKWCASIEMNTNATGASFEITSGHEHDSPDDAVRVLISRLRAALATIGGAQ